MWGSPSGRSCTQADGYYVSPGGGYEVNAGSTTAGITDITGSASIGVQLIGIAAAFLWTFPVAFVMFRIIDMVVGLMVSAEDEKAGLDISEHAPTSYPDFTISRIGSPPAPFGKIRYPARASRPGPFLLNIRAH